MPADQRRAVDWRTFVGLSPDAPAAAHARRPHVIGEATEAAVTVVTHPVRVTRPGDGQQGCADRTSTVDGQDMVGTVALGFGPRYRSPIQRDEVDESELGRSLPPRGGEEKHMDLGTKAILFGLLALVLCWMPLLNVIGFIAGLITVAFGLIGRSNNASVGEVNRTRATIGLVMGVVALLGSVVSTYVLLQAYPV